VGTIRRRLQARTGKPKKASVMGRQHGEEAADLTVHQQVNETGQ
jgi:hypothetical protein